jgi:hypothetical protein
VADEDEDNGKEPRTIGQEEMVNTSADDADSIVHTQPTVLPEQSKEMCGQTPWRQPPASARWTTIPGASPTTTNSGDLYSQWAGVFGGCDGTEISPSGSNCARS